MPLVDVTGVTDQAVQNVTNTLENTTNRVVDRLDERIDLGVLENNIEGVGTAAAGALHNIGRAAETAANAHTAGTVAGILTGSAQLVHNIVAPGHGRAQPEGRAGLQMDIGINQSNPSQSLANGIKAEATIILSQAAADARVIVVPVGVSRMLMCSVRSLPAPENVDRWLLPPKFIGGYMTLQSAVNDVTAHILGSPRREKPQEQTIYAFVFYDLQRTALFKAHSANFPQAMFGPGHVLRFISAASTEKPFDRFDIRSTVGDTEATRRPVLFIGELHRANFVNFAFCGPERMFGLNRWRQYFTNWSFMPAATSVVVEGAAVSAHHGLFTLAATHLHVVANGTCLVGGPVGIGLSAALSGGPALIYGARKLYGTNVWQTEDEIASLFRLCDRCRIP